MTVTPASPPVPDPVPLLSVTGLSRSFGGLQAVREVAFTVEAHAIYGLIGPNGSGKTTVFNLLSGFLAPDAGSVSFGGRELVGLKPFAVARAGLVRTFQAPLNPPHMTVMQNMLLAPQGQSGESVLRALLRPGRVRAEERAALDRAWEILTLVKMDHQADTPAGALSGGQKKLLALAQALMARPRLILLDEPVAGVNPRLIDDIVDIIRTLRDQGQTFLIVEHNMSVVRRLCDRISVLDAGAVVASGPPAETLARQDVLEAYLGGHHAPPHTHPVTSADAASAPV